MSRVVYIEPGKPVRLGTYIEAWKRCKTLAATGNTDRIRLHPHSLTSRTAAGWLRWFRAGMHDRINEATPVTERGITPRSNT